MKRNSNVYKFAALLLVFAVVISAVPVLAADTASIPEDAQPAVAAHIYEHAYNIIINPGKDDRSYNFNWYSLTSKDQELQWVESSQLVDGEFPAEVNSAVAERGEAYGSSYRFVAQMTELNSNSEYSYRIGSDDLGWSQTYTVKTGNFDDNTFSFVLVGDPQIGASIREYDGESWNVTLEKAVEWFGDDIEFLMSAGDQVNSGDFEPEFETFTTPGFLRSHMIMTTVGNHDNEPVYSRHYNYSDVDQNTTADSGEFGGDYWVAYDGALIICLNTNDSSAARHKTFMEKAIAEYTEAHGDPTWKLVFFHHSLYSAAGGRWEEASYRRETLSPVFSDLGIDAVMMGHDHVYTRAYMMNDLTPIDDAELYTEVNGDPYGSYFNPKEGEVFYITANSSSGSKFYDLSNDVVPYAAVKNQESTPNLTKVDVTGDCITFTTYRTSTNNDLGDVMDFFAIHRTEGTEEDTYAPMLNVPNLNYYLADEEFNYLDGVSAYDNRDGDLTDKIVVTGELNPNVESVLTYTVEDAAGNVVTKQRKVIPVSGTRSVSREETVWKYLDDGSVPFDVNGTQIEWTAIDFDDSSWKEAKGGFGAINGEIGDHNGITPATLLNPYYPEGSDDEGINIPNFFFRTTFDVDFPDVVNLITAEVWYDDAIKIYINGVPVKALHTEMSGSNFGYCGNNCESTFYYSSLRIDDEEFIKSLNLKAKGNVLAVELFQANLGSEDIFFDFGSLFVGKTARNFPFEDVATDSWYYNSVAKAYNNGMFTGTTETLFSPKMTMTRAMTWTVLARIAGADITTDGKWYEGAQKWSLENGVSDGTNPHNELTREQLAQMLYALSGKPEVEGDLDAFTDKDEASSWATDGLIWAVANEILSGKGNGILDPKATASRAEACTMLIKYLEVN